MVPQRSLSSLYVIWFGVVLFYLYQYILRVSPSVMADDLMAAFHVSASGFSSLSAFALYSYALMQIPVGMLVDHFGTRRMILCSIFCCVSGVILFASSEKLGIAYLARMMMGTGSACAFLSVSKIVNEWFPDSKKGIMLGLAATFGTIGALLGGAPLVMLTSSYGWRGSLMILAGIGVVVLVLNFFILPKTHKGDKEVIPGEESTSYRSLMLVFKSAQTWIFAFVAVGIYMSISVVADLWGVSFVIEKFEVEKADAAQMISFIYIGAAIGCPLFAWISRIIHSLKATIFIGGLGVVGLLGYIVFVPDIPVWAASIVFFGIGLGAGAEILCFTGACSLMGPAVAGTMTGFLNCIVTLASAMIQQNVGVVLDYFWDGALSPDSTPLYSIYTYQVAFGLIILCTLLSCLLALFIKSPAADNESRMVVREVG